VSVTLKLPADYAALSPEERREARQEYARRQNGLCYHCNGSLDAEPPESVQRLSINWKLFPPNFLRYPHHLHHSHDTGMTLGVVHARCNAVLWQYHGE
jgi:hypothetical protein